jgi:hypothetical protein
MWESISGDAVREALQIMPDQIGFDGAITPEVLRQIN